jgi:hypothetical protein
MNISLSDPWLQTTFYSYSCVVLINIKVTKKMQHVYYSVVNFNQRRRGRGYRIFELKITVRENVDDIHNLALIFHVK